ncbi:nucleoside triphosphate pyrophosphohydrolase [Gallaecimonas sp. GXIMD4217]|uniref:nucleoside triphosphate pyrophosphohydrolase n=1 Tax=Gallaecimonas sp. GXIMD4217 TaxID=3131927 RepID=UPI00311B08B2
MTPIDRLKAIMARLRDPEGGCPWDLQQSFQTIVPHTLEEAYEVADAIERGDRSDIKEELGDLLFQVIFYARLGEEEGAFDFDAIASAVSDKLERRHPHVFGELEVGDETEVLSNWEAIKSEERREKGLSELPSALDDVPLALPALTRAAKLQKRAARTGFDWAELAPVLAKIHEEIDEVKQEVEQGVSREALEEELGDLLFAVVNLNRHLRVDPESALRRANQKFERRFRGIERRVFEAGQQMSELDLAALDAHWEAVKATEKE